MPAFRRSPEQIIIREIIGTSLGEKHVKTNALPKSGFDHATLHHTSFNDLRVLRHLQAKTEKQMKWQASSSRSANVICFDLEPMVDV